MSGLSNLQLGDVTKARPQAGENSVEKFINSVTEQIEAAKAQSKGEDYIVERVKWEEKDGEKKKITVKRSLRKWFAVTDDGKWFIAVRYGNRPLEIADGKHCVICGDFKNVTPALKTLLAAAQEGELDDAIKAARTKKSTKK